MNLKGCFCESVNIHMFITHCDDHRSVIEGPNFQLTVSAPSVCRPVYDLSS